MVLADSRDGEVGTGLVTASYTCIPCLSLRVCVFVCVCGVCVCAGERASGNQAGWGVPVWHCSLARGIGEACAPANPPASLWPKLVGGEQRLPLPRCSTGRRLPWWSAVAAMRPFGGSGWSGGGGWSGAESRGTSRGAAAAAEQVGEAAWSAQMGGLPGWPTVLLGWLGVRLHEQQLAAKSGHRLLTLTIQAGWSSFACLWEAGQIGGCTGPVGGTC